MVPSRLLLSAGALLALTTVNATQEREFAAGELDFFERHVRPVLIESCIKCHGPTKQKSGLRLDSRAAMIAGGRSGPAIVPGKPEESLLVSVIRYGGDVEMPPADRLRDDVIARITRWVRSGAPWPENVAVNPAASKKSTAEHHWAFQAIDDPPLPPVRTSSWVKTPIDRFILARLEKSGLEPSPPADRRTLIRRASFDMIGLPPTPDEVRAFEEDPSPRAFEKIVDRLLASPRHGERWGRYWLDVARYADTKGYVFFEEKDFPWAYTYRDYVVGAFNDDLPYDDFVVQQLAGDCLPLGDDRRALTAMGFLTLGQHFMNNQHDIIDDRIDVVTRGLLGLTVSCARCHDHKYDPIPTADYYSLYGVFASSIEPDVRPLFLPPPTSTDYAEFEKELKARVEKLRDFIRAKHTELIDGARSRIAEYLLEAHAAASHPTTESFMLLADPGDLNPQMIVRWKNHLKQTRTTHDPVLAPWHAFASLRPDEFPRQAARLAVSFVTVAPDRPINQVVARAFAEAPPRDLSAAASVYGRVINETDARWKQMLQTAADAGQPPPREFPDPEREELRQLLYHPGAPLGVPLPELGFNLLSLLPDRESQGELKKRLKAVESWQKNGPAAPPRAMVLIDAKTSIEPRVFHRGNPNRLGETVPRQFLSVLTGKSRQPFGEGSGRLELARAIASPENPLTARVIVNRLWMHHFGGPLVATPSDFGVRSTAPTHPDLLDHLATRLIRDGWSLKRLHRVILLSATYQQRSRDREDCSSVDPENRLLWKMSRRRLDFESMRDAFLEVTGTLSRQIGGPPTSLTSMPVSIRRSIYGRIDRLGMPSLLRTFDFPSPEATSARRFSTTVAPQALFLMNHPFIVECARRLAERPDIAGEESLPGRVERLFSLLFHRAPTSEEIELARLFLRPISVSVAAPADASWTYGHGELDQTLGRVKSFVELPHWTGSRWQPGPGFPHPELGHAFLDAEGGHAVKDANRVVVRRWTAPFSGELTIEGELRHGEKEGDGVRALMLSGHGAGHGAGQNGRLGEWTAHNAEVATIVPRVEVKSGDTLDFVVGPRESDTHDDFKWMIVIRRSELDPGSRGPRAWNSRIDFRGPQVGPWVQYAQALLLLNEFVYID